MIFLAGPALSGMIIPGTGEFSLGFTDYKAQGQTICPVIIDIGNTPTAKLNPFNAYVAMSRGTGRTFVRLLRDFESDLFTKHPGEELAEYDRQLEEWNEETKEAHLRGQW
jgi:hypothetical protein